jgi:hypothetical protein
VGERAWNQRLSGKTGLRWLLCGNAAVAVRERVENTGPGASVADVPSAPASVKALRFAPTAGAARKGRAALTAASAAGGGWS